MEIERRRSARSFFNLFEWNGASRKKPFHANLDLPAIEDLKQAKKNVNMPEPQLYRTEVNENEINPSSMASCDLNCELSVSSDVGCETKAPCLVARLMGLDSLPTSTVNKLSSTALHAFNSSGSSQCHEGAVASMDSRAHEAMRILDLKQKSGAACYAPTHREIVDTDTVKSSRDLEKISPHHYGSKGKSTSLAIQAKADVQRRDTLTSNGNRGYKQNELNRIASNQFFRTQKPILKQVIKQRTCTSWNRHYNDVGQNKQMQNKVTNSRFQRQNKGRSTSIVDSKAPTTRSSPGGARKTTNKDAVIDSTVRPNSSGRRATGATKEFPLIKTKSNSIKKRNTKWDVLPVNAVNNHESKSIKCNSTTDGSMNQNALNKSANKGIISFTFTSPLNKGSLSSTHTNNVDVNARGLQRDGGALSVVFDREVQDLTSRINSPECTLATGVISAVLLSREVSIESGEVDRSFHSDPHSGKLHSAHNFGCCSSDDRMLNMNKQLQGTKALLQSNVETECHQDYLDVAAEQECDLSTLEDAKRSRNLELEFVKDMLSNGELMEEKCEGGETITNKGIIKTNVFDMLEDWSSGTESDGAEQLKGERNLLFDFVSECLQFRRSRQTFIGRYKAGPGALHSEIWREEDLYTGIQRFKSMQGEGEGVMVDELVHMNISSPHATWLHSHTEPFPVEIERHISTWLINDLVFDLLHH